RPPYGYRAPGYWHYCPSYAAYSPNVTSCPGGLGARAGFVKSPENEGTVHEPCAGRGRAWVVTGPLRILPARTQLKTRVPLYKGRIASRRFVENGKGSATFTTLAYSFEPRSRLFGSHLARSQAGTTSARDCYRSRKLLLPYASRRNAPTRAG